ncbi:MAG TPA: hypothetical protein VMB84_01425 [Stellaceae bacterium]|nr:hypothetical protein [Stellaceae bacterium]
MATDQSIIERAATQMIERHGAERAADAAKQRVRLLLEVGDKDAADTWQRVAQAINVKLAAPLQRSIQDTNRQGG